jgi:hypothetical protein
MGQKSVDMFGAACAAFVCNAWLRQANLSMVNVCASQANWQKSIIHDKQEGHNID